MVRTEQPAPPAAEIEAHSFRFRFRIVHVIYVVTLLGTSLATFGPLGFFAFVIVGAFWGAVFANRARAMTLLEVGLVAVICIVLICVLYPAISTPREVSRRMSCANNLKQIALALHNYHDLYGSFPPAYVADENGQPMHSWRVLILPYLEQEPLYKRYKFDEPWDGPNNSRLLKEMPSVYACPSNAHGFAPDDLNTSYVAVVGSKTAWPGAQSRQLPELSHGTLLIVEHHNESIAWLKPDDLQLDGALDILTNSSPAEGHRYETFFFRQCDGRNVALADGSVRFVVNDADRRSWSAVLTTGDRKSWEELERRQQGRERWFWSELKLGNCLRLAIWGVVVFLPLPWVWTKPDSKHGGGVKGRHSPAADF